MYLRGECWDSLEFATVTDAYGNADNQRQMPHRLFPHDWKGNVADLIIPEFGVMGAMPPDDLFKTAR
jgi:hypothetical protein